jgi:nitrite reductase/ring-hydroxylating ferredoxin subunit
MAKLIPVAPLTELKNDKPICVEHRGIPYCVVRTKKNNFKAYVTICSHKDLAMFPAEVKKGNLICPYHDAAFKISTGKPLKSNRKKADRLPKVEVEIVEGIVHIEARKNHRKLVPRSERKWVKKEGKQLRKKQKEG